MNEFPIRVPDPDRVLEACSSRGVLGGIDAGRWFPELAGTMVFCCTELNDPAAIEALLEAVGGA